MNADAARRPLDYLIVDCDNHYCEPDDCFTRRIEERCRPRAVRTGRGRADGSGRRMPGEERLRFFSAGAADCAGCPGAMEAFFQGRDEGANRPGESFRRHFRAAPFHSGFPHPEGLEWPQETARRLEGFSAAETRAALRDNACRACRIPGIDA